MHMAEWMEVLYDSLGSKRRCRKHSFLNMFFFPVKACIIEQKEAHISQFSGTTDPLTGKTETRGNLNLPLAFTAITSQTDIPAPVLCPGQEVAACVITEHVIAYYAGFVLQSVLPTGPARPMFFLWEPHPALLWDNFSVEIFCCASLHSPKCANA